MTMLMKRKMGMKSCLPGFLVSYLYFGWLNLNKEIYKALKHLLEALIQQMIFLNFGFNGKSCF